ncbi:aminodeoxychorismate synthase component I [Agromyces italicus]|uniref:aminodeoxychorismate synthase component I n=1 Tax=Agromyces italicus TaxID=279572 RepID=UPI0003B53AA6|nr:aminodeoxychorismate synthase component I [Agromyces italicus]
MPRRIRSRALGFWRDPAEVFRTRYADAEYVVWLDGGDAANGMSVLGRAHPRSEFVTAVLAANEDARPGTGRVEAVRPVADAPTATVREGSMFELLAEALALPVVALAPAERAAGPLGWFGWFGYELGAAADRVPVANAETPDAAFLFLDRVLVFDHAARELRLVWLDSDDGEAWADDEAQTLGGRVDGDGDPATTSHPHRPTAAPTRAPVARWRHDAARYAELIEECQAAIVRGDAYQLCLTNRVDVDVHPDPAETYLALRTSSPSHHGGYLRFGEFALLSASPEQFLLVEPSGRVSTKPMKGTRPRDADPFRDAALRAELLASHKERAENLMIVDLMRNDLGRVAELGSVGVDGLLEVEEYAHVHQLVSTVHARIAPPLSVLDVVRAAFPAGSMTGAPKHSAMAILHGLEQGPRGVYSGAFGYLGVDGGADLAMVIRSIVLTPSGASIGTGGGITALSVASEEIEETRVKARALLAVLDAASTPAE